MALLPYNFHTYKNPQFVRLCFFYSRSPFAFAFTFTFDVWRAKCSKFLWASSFKHQLNSGKHNWAELRNSLMNLTMILIIQSTANLIADDHHNFIFDIFFYFSSIGNRHTYTETHSMVSDPITFLIIKRFPP